MNRHCVFLLCLLVAQLGLLGWMLQGSREDSSGAIQQLVDTRSYVVDSITIEGADGTVARLVNRGNGWILPALERLPADEARISALLDTLTETDPGWAIANSSAARQRLQVASYRFRRKVTLEAQGQSLGTVFLGTSPGFGKLHARSDDSDAIYSLTLNRHELPTRDAGWIKPDILQVRAPLSITADGYSLQRKSGDWRLGNGQVPAAEPLQALLAALKQLRVEGIAGEAVDTALRPTQAELILAIESLRGEFTLEFYQKGTDYFVRSSQFPYLFRIPGYDFERVTGLDAMILARAE